MEHGIASAPTAEMAEIARRPLQAEHCALAVIDIQEKLLPPIFNKEQLVRNSQLLIRLAGILGIPVLLSTQYAKGLGRTVAAISDLLPATDAIDKLEFGCFANDHYCDAAKTLPGRRTTLLLCGMEAHICVMQTALGALRKGYLVHVAADAVGSRAESNWQVGLERMRTAGAIISSTETVIYELLHASGTDAFKQMLAHLK